MFQLIHLYALDTESAELYFSLCEYIEPIDKSKYYYDIRVH